MAFEASQKYKEGKFIIEKARLLKVGPLLVPGMPGIPWVVSVTLTE